MHEIWGTCGAALGTRLSAPWVASLGSALGRALWWLLPKRRGLAYASVHRRLGVPGPAAERIARESFRHTGMAFAEIFQGRHTGPRFLHEQVIVERPDLLTALFSSTRPAVVVSGHLGAWELLVALMALFPHRPACQVVVRLPKSPFLRGLILHARNQARIRTVGHRDASAGVLAMLRAGGLAAFLVDHHCRQAEAERLLFLGREASVNRGPALLAVRAKAEVWPLFLVREPRIGSFRLLQESPLDTRGLTGDPAARVRSVCRFYTQAVEHAVCRYPEQWLWMHRRWKA
ncbi:acyltransferase [Thermodesulfomicrobium sp. WS]|uniref:lysophospholipid acyltransferase family protein n=1 Tax=Thermodesulfomicrobium sp. WS TaxID=3004129 RepID=UPI00248F9011|nr:lysophospholipid acyltransferase family protein [Thermodesulfomicrobium sp. WS]BDV01341.1 acyltransferase [Thermodesulfomicrobium sp. WS]